MLKNWRKVAAITDVPVDGTLQCQIKEHAICLYNVAGKIYATDDACTHGAASLADGFIVNDSEIECSYHQGRFDIRTGKATAAPCSIGLRTYPVRIVDGDVLVRFEGTAGTE